MKITGLQKVTLIDFPGHIAASVFLGGCNCDCGYCHNRWMIDEAAAPEAISVPSLLGWLDTRRDLLDGVCVSGGEPTIHADLASLLQPIKGMGFDIKLDTNGTLPHRLRDLLESELLDYVALDIKAPLDVRYSRVVRRPIDAAKVRESMELLRASGVQYEFRTTVGPDLSIVSDGEAVPRALRDIAALFRPDETWYLQPYEETPTVDTALLSGPSLTAAQLEGMIEVLRALAPGARLRGTD